MAHKEYKSYFEKVIIDIESEMIKYLKKNSNKTDSYMCTEKHKNTSKKQSDQFRHVLPVKASE